MNLCNLTVEDLREVGLGVFAMCKTRNCGHQVGQHRPRPAGEGMIHVVVFYYLHPKHQLRCDLLFHFDVANTCELIDWQN